MICSVLRRFFISKSGGDDVRKQLTVTLVFLLVSLCVLGTASYAWYSNNKITTASGMSLSVVFPIYIVASLEKAESVTSLEGFHMYFEFGSAELEGENPLINEYDMLAPVTSSDGMNFLYLPFRCVGNDGCPKEGTTVDDYLTIPESASRGYFIDIPMYVITTTPFDLQVYINNIDIFSPIGGSGITGAVRCAVLVKENGVYRSLIVAKDREATPLVGQDGKAYYPMIADGVTAKYADSDEAAYESEYYMDNPEVLNPYLPENANTFTLRRSEKVGGVTTYYTTEVHLRVWIEGSDRNAVFQNAGEYFSVAISMHVVE
jgi:hypothetical protein